MERQQLESDGSGWTQVVGCFQHGNKTLATQHGIS